MKGHREKRGCCLSLERAGMEDWGLQDRGGGPRHGARGANTQPLSSFPPSLQYLPLKQGSQTTEVSLPAQSRPGKRLEWMGTGRRGKRGRKVRFAPSEHESMRSGCVLRSRASVHFELKHVVHRTLILFLLLSQHKQGGKNNNHPCFGWVHSGAWTGTESTIGQGWGAVMTQLE